MATIKTIARMAGVSTSTVSIILNGKAKERKISSATEKEVLAIAASIGYRHNVGAASLRAADSTFHYQIVIFWIADYRAEMMTRFFKAIEQEIMSAPVPCSVLLKSYEPGKLNLAMTDELIRSCHGIIICNSSEKDLEIIENSDFLRPIVLYNRYSKKYSAVTMDDKSIGLIPAQAFASHGKRNPLIITSEATFNGMNLRANVFSYSCTENGMNTPPVCCTPPTAKGGYDATIHALEKYPTTDCIFYSTDSMIPGAVKAFFQKSVSIPGQIEIIAVGNNPLDRCEYTIPSVSVVYLHMEKMAVQCFQALYRLMTYEQQEPEFINLPGTYIPRDSCPEY